MAYSIGMSLDGDDTSVSRSPRTNGASNQYNIWSIDLMGRDQLGRRRADAGALLLEDKVLTSRCISMTKPAFLGRPSTFGHSGGSSSVFPGQVSVSY